MFSYAPKKAFSAICGQVLWATETPIMKPLGIPQFRFVDQSSLPRCGNKGFCGHGGPYSSFLVAVELLVGPCKVRLFGGVML